MEGKKKPRDRRQRFYCAYADISSARRKVHQGKRKVGKIVEYGEHANATPAVRAPVAAN